MSLIYLRFYEYMRKNCFRVINTIAFNLASCDSSWVIYDMSSDYKKYKFFAKKFELYFFV